MSSVSQIEEQFIGVAINLPIPISFCDKDFNILFVNNKFTELYGYTQQDIPTMKEWGEKAYPDEQYRDLVLGELDKQVQDYTKGIAKDCIFTSKIVCMNGTKKDVETMIYLDGEYRYAVFNDITEQKQVEEAMRLSEEKFSKFFELSPDAVSISRMDGTYLDVNKGFENLSGFTKDMVIGKNVKDFDLWANYRTRDYMVQEIQNYGEVNNLEALFNCRGKLRWGLLSARTIHIGGETCLIISNREITDRKKAEERLCLSEEKYRTIFEASNDGIFIHDLKTGKVLDANQKACKISGYDYAEIMIEGLNVFGLNEPPYSMNEVDTYFVQAVNDEPQFFEWRNTQKDGDYKWLEVSMKKVAMENEEFIISVVRDITDRKKAEEQLVYLSLHDSVTGLYNRIFFEAQIRVYQKIRDNTTGLIVCDVDGLKFINDTLGHNLGDRVLKEVAQILNNTFRNGEVVSRIGGDEFAVLFSSSTTQALASACRRIEEGIKLYNTDNPTIPISLSMGYAVGSNQYTDMKELFIEADRNMYKEKLYRKKSARSAIVDALMKALEARDYLTEGHAERLQKMILPFATAIGMSESSKVDLRLFAHFHDLGKVGIPDSILLKPGSLTPEEWEIMKTHCEIGYRIAISAPDLVPIADWIRKHHEWWNGKGYSLGLAGEEIPLECRILAITDAYDAMTSDRPYRKGMSRADALTEIKRCAGIQFDPELVRIFEEII